MMQLLLEGKVDLGLTYGVQLHKAIQQVASDNGYWGNAAHLLPTEDPSLEDNFGGDPEELEEIAARLEAVQKLRTRSNLESKNAKKEVSWDNAKQQWTPKAKKKAAGAPTG